MDSQLLISPDKLSRVRLTSGEYWVRLALRLTGAFTGGNAVQFSPDAAVSIEGADPLSFSYNRANWMSGVTSGVLYAFRTLRIPRQCVVLTELTGHLRASDMDAVANSSAIAIAKLAERELPSLPTDGWTIQASVAECKSPTSSVGSEKRSELTPSGNESTCAKAEMASAKNREKEEQSGRASESADKDPS